MDVVDKWELDQNGVYRNEKYFKGHYIQNLNGKWNLHYDYAKSPEIPLKSLKTLDKAIDYIEK